jgi:hypothetical protein
VEAIGTLAAIAALVLAFGLGAWLPSRYALAPLRRPWRSTRGPWQFGLLDYCALFVVLQYALAAAGIAWRWNATFGTAATLYLVIAAIGLWLAGMKGLARVPVVDPRRRFVFLVVVVPLVAAMSLGAPMGIMVLIRAVSNDWPWLSWPVTLTLAMPAATWICRRIVDWVVQRPKALSAGPLNVSNLEMTTTQD